MMIVLGQENQLKAESLFGDASYAVACGKLSEEEIAALISYVVRGGSALIAGQAALQENDSLAFLRCAAAGASDAKVFPFMSPLHLETEAGTLFEVPVPVTFSTMKATEIYQSAVYGKKKIPIAWGHRWGSGHVYVSTVQTAEGLQTLAKDIRAHLPESDTEYRKIVPRKKSGRALLIAGGPTGFHPFSEELRQILTQLFPTIATVSHTLEEWDAEKLKTYDVVYFYNVPLYGRAGDSETVTALIEYLACGGAICNLHFMCPGGVPELAQIFGGTFRMHPPYNHYEFVFMPSDITQGGEVFDLNDEMHQLILEELSHVEKLIVCRNRNGVAPEYGPAAHQDIYGKNSGMGATMAWKGTFGYGKIAYTCPGHRPEAFQNPAYAAFLQRLDGWLSK